MWHARIYNKPINTWLLFIDEITKKHQIFKENFIRRQDLFKETEIRDSIDISLHLTKDDFQDGDMSRQKGRLSFPPLRSSCEGTMVPILFNRIRNFLRFSFSRAHRSCPNAIINDICSCNDHLIEVKESNLFAVLFSKIQFFF